MLEAIDLTKQYEAGVLALDHLNLEVKPGELFALLGANGAGKTTSINLMLNFLDPTDGTAKINGIDVVAEPLKAKAHVAFLPENVLLYGNLTVTQNLDFFAKVGGKRHVTREEHYMVLRRVGLPEQAFEMRVRKLSKGMRQRLGIAIVVTKDAPVVILDEPTSGLDPQGAADFCDLLRELRDEGKAVFMSTHDVFRAREIADRVGIMKEGHLVMVRGRDDLKYENLEEIYLNYMRAA